MLKILLAKAVKKELPLVMNVFGGHHVKAIPEELENEKAIDYLVWGPVYGSVDKILCLLFVAPPKKGSLKNLANGSRWRFLCVRCMRSSSIIAGGIVDRPTLVGNNATDISSTS